MQSVIPLDSLRIGITLSLENAERLLKDARILFKNKRYASATCLVTLSLEEVGKAVLLVRDFLLGPVYLVDDASVIGVCVSSRGANWQIN